MRFMIIVKGNKDTEAGVMPEEKLFADMADYHEELARKGALLEAAGLHPTADGWRIKYSGGKRTVIDGPFTEAKEIVAGFTIFKANSRQEALDWVKRFPNPMGEGADGEIEVRQLYESDELPPSESVERFRETLTQK